MSIHSDMEILSDMLNGEESPYGNIIEVDQELSYYNGFGIELTKQIKTEARTRTTKHMIVSSQGSADSP